MAFPDQSTRCKLLHDTHSPSSPPTPISSEPAEVVEQTEVGKGGGEGERVKLKGHIRKIHLLQHRFAFAGEVSSIGLATDEVNEKIVWGWLYRERKKSLNPCTLQN